MRLHRRELPPYVRQVKHREVLSSSFAFDLENKIVLISYLAKKSKNVVILSSSHSGRNVQNDELRKPLAILDYNRSKGGVDTMDENVEEFTVRRKTVRWPLLLFYNIIDVAINNAFIMSRKSNMNVTKNS